MSKTSPPAPSGSVKASTGMRVGQIAVGALALILGGLVLAYPGAGFAVVIFWLSLALLFGGIEGIITGIWARHLSGGWRAFSIAGGMIAIGLSFSVYAFPGAAALTMVFFFSLALMILGAAGIARGLLEKRLSGWYRALLIGAGSVALILSTPVLIYPVMFGLPTIYAFLSAALIVIGVSYIAAGVSGAVFRPTGRIRRGVEGSWDSEAA